MRVALQKGEQAKEQAVDTERDGIFSNARNKGSDVTQALAKSASA